MRIAIATCQKKPEGTDDDRLLTSALEARGHEAASAMWSDSTVSWESFDICLLRSPWDYYLCLPKFLQWAESVHHQTTLLNPLATVKTNAEKDYLLDLETNGFPIVPSQIFTNRESALSAAKELRKECSIIVKPTVSGGSYLTFFPKSEAELEQAVNKVLAHGKLLLQPYLHTIETQGEISLMYFRVGAKWEYSHAVLKTAATGEFRVQTNFGGKVELFEPSLPILSLANSILETLHPKDIYVRIDLVDWQTEPKIGELELIEPALFFGQNKNSAPLLVKALEAI